MLINSVIVGASGWLFNQNFQTWMALQECAKEVDLQKWPFAVNGLCLGLVNTNRIRPVLVFLTDKMPPVSGANLTNSLSALGDSRGPSNRTLRDFWEIS